MKLTECVAEFADTLSVDPERGFVVACSGGPDSVALLFALADYCRTRHIKIGCAHLNHGLRSDAEHEQDRLIVRAHADRLSIPFHYRALSPGVLKELAQNLQCGEEAAARTARYRFFRDVAHAERYQYVAVGHTLDDNCETLLQRVFQGSGWGGLAGIPAANDAVVRPLLRVSRRHVLAYVRCLCLRTATDPTNFSGRYLRNRIRNYLIPAAERVFPGYRGALQNLSEKSAMVRDLVATAANGALEWSREGEAAHVSGAEFYAAPEAVRLQTLYRVVDMLSPDPDGGLRVPYSLLRQVVHADGRRANGEIAEGAAFRFETRAGRLWCRRQVVFVGENGYLFVVQTPDEAGHQSCLGRFCIRRVVPSGAYGKNALVVPTATIAFPLLVRSRRAGDFLNLPEGGKTLKKLFNDWGVPPEQRWSVPVIQDRRGVFAVAGAPFGYENRVSTERRVHVRSHDAILIDEV